MADYVPLCEYLPYETYDPEQHVWRCRDHLGWVLQVSPQVGWDPQLINSLTHWLVEQCPAEAVLHIQCVALPPADTAFPSCPASLTPDSALYHVLQARAAHLQQGTIVPLAGHSETLRDFHVLISGTLPRKKTALSEAVRFREQVMQTLQAKSVACGVVAINPWLRWLRWYLNPTVSPSLRDAPWCPHTPLAHQVVSPETQWVVTADAIHVQPAHWQIVPLVVSAFPPEWHAGDAMRFLGHVFHSYQQIPGPFCINLVLRAIPKYRAEQTATVKLWKANRYSHPLIRQFIPRLAKEHTDWAAVKQRLDGQDTLVSLQLSVQLWQPAPQMAQAITKTRALFRSQGITLVPERYIQLPQVLGTLPCGHHLGLFERLSRFGRMKTVCASHAASVFPIYGESKGLGQLMYLTGRSGQLMGFDPFANPSSNYNIAITGTSGSGKSVFLQDLVTLSVAGKRHVFVIDIGRSFEALCHSLGGQFIAFDLQSRLSLNPFTHIRDIDVSQSIVMPLLLAMGSPRDPVSRAVESRLEQCVQALWATHGNATTITLIAEKLCADPDRRVADLGQGLYPFTASGRYGRWFEPPCTLCVENPFIVFELEELKDKPDLQSTVFFGVDGAYYRNDVSLGSQSTRDVCDR